MVRVWVVLVMCDCDEMGLVCCGEDVIEVMMSLYFIEPYRFTVKNILQQIGGVVEWKSLGIELDIDPAKLDEIHQGRIQEFRKGGAQEGGGCGRGMCPLPHEARKL